MELRRIIISRTDGIGDVMLSLPMAGALKSQYPNLEIIFLGRSYTEPIIAHCHHISSFLDLDQYEGKSLSEELSKLNADAIIHVFPVMEISTAAKKAKIPIRIGTSHRLYHLHTCNKLLNLGRKNSNLHEAQLNLQLLKPLGVTKNFELVSIPSYYGFKSSAAIHQHIDPDRFNLILHPKSKGSAREWGIENFSALINLLDENEFKIIITGTEQEGKQINKTFFDKHPNAVDLTGKMSLDEMIGFIAKADGLLAASTGPLHIAAALGKHAIGLFPPMRPIHPRRWSPLGKRATYFVKDKACSDCKTKRNCACMESITPVEVRDHLTNVCL